MRKGVDRSSDHRPLDKPFLDYNEKDNSKNTLFFNFRFVKIQLKTEILIFLGSNIFLPRTVQSGSLTVNPMRPKILIII